MIVKNHNILLKDTSEAEMARFRQIMLGIWRQQIEDDKNVKVMENSFADYQLNSNTNSISIRRVAQSIKKHLGQVHKPMAFNNLIGEEPYPFCIPMNAENLIYDDSQGNKKNGVILLKWLSFNGINLKPETFKASIEIGDEHTDFTLTIFQDDLKEIAFKFTMHDFDLFMALFVELGIRYTDIANQAVIDLYRKKIEAANDDPDKLDVIYQSLPKILFGKGDDAERYKHLDLILKSMYEFGGSAGTNEDKAVLQILYAMNDRYILYTILRDTDNGLLFEIYRKLQGEELQDLLRFLTRLVEEFDTYKPTDKVYFDNSYYLFRNTHIKTDLTDGNILLSNYKDATEMTLTKDHKNVMETYVPEYYIKNKSFNPLAKLNFGTKLGDFGEQVGDENTFVIALKLHSMATKQSNWDLFNIVTDFLSLLSAVGALRVVLAKGAPLALRALAGLTLAKDATHYAMLSAGTLEKWHDNGLGWLAQLWVAFSVTVDLASLGFYNLSKIAKEGKVAGEMAETAEDARKIKKVTDEANKIIKEKTGKDVSKMGKKQFQDFTMQAIKNERKLITLADVNQLGTATKIELVDNMGENIGYITRNMRYPAKKTITYQFSATKESGSIKIGNKINLNCNIRLLDSKLGQKMNLNVKEGEEILYLDLNIPPKINDQYSGLGKIIFDDAHTFLKSGNKIPEINGMFGHWLKNPSLYAHYGDESINLKKFWNAYNNGMSETEAAFETITGKWAKENKYTKVYIQTLKKDEVVIKFLKE